MEQFDIRVATKTDTSVIYQFIKDLAEYEKLSHELVATEKVLKESLFGKNQFAKVIIAYSNRMPVGFALYFYNYSTFLGKPGIYLEDLFVRPEFRGKGIGKALLARLAQIAINEDCGRVEWSVLNWNKPAIDFYKSIGAKAMDEWSVYRLTGNDIKRLAEN